MVGASRLLTMLLTLSITAFLMPAGSAEAAINDPIPFDGTITIPADPEAAREDAFLISGALAYASPLRGLLVAAADEGSSFTVGQIEVYDSNDGEAFFNRDPAYEATNAVLSPVAGASFAWSFPQADSVGETRHTVSILVDVESNIPDDADAFVTEREGGPLPHLVLDGREGTWTFDNELGRSSFFPLHQGFTVTADGRTETFDGTDWVAFMELGTEADVSAVALAIPTHPDLELTFLRAGDDAYTDRFSSDSVNGFISTALDLADLVANMEGPEGYTPPTCPTDPEACLPSIPPANHDGSGALMLDRVRSAWSGASAAMAPSDRDASMSQHQGDADTGDRTGNESSELGIPAGIIEGAGSVLNGALLGEVTGNLTVGDRAATMPGLTILRFDELVISNFETGQVGVTGQSSFAYTEGEAYHTTSTISVAYFIIPVLSIILFIIGIVMFVVSRVLRRDGDADKGDGLRLFSLIARFGLLAVALVLFDRELFQVFGESVLGTLGFWGGSGFTLQGLGFIFLVEALVWGYASFLFGFPIGLIGRGVLRLTGFSKRTYGFVAGGAALFAFVLGASLIRPILGAVLGTVEGAL